MGAYMFIHLCLCLCLLYSSRLYLLSYSTACILNKVRVHDSQIAELLLLLLLLIIIIIVCVCVERCGKRLFKKKSALYNVSTRKHPRFYHFSFWQFNSDRADG